MQLLSRFFFALISSFLLTASVCFADVAPWNADTQGQFITALCPGGRGTIWIGTEGNGVWRYDPAAPTGKQYSHYTTHDGLGDDNAYALVCDKAGRVWVGTLNHGVSVFNGKQWRTYGPTDGPLGSRVFALAVSPHDGGVWGATEFGLFRYAQSRWTYFTCSDGLPSDQANALAFDADGTLYVGTQCDGVAIASPADGYKTWRVVPGPIALPNAPGGAGLPCALINCLLVTQSGTVYAGTDAGLAASTDEGQTWTYRRGLDWKAKEEGLYPAVTPSVAAVSGDILSEDYVTALAEGADGNIFVGHRQTGVEAFSLKTGLRAQSGLNGAKTDSFISSLLVSGQGAWVGLYGGGVLPLDAAPTAASLASSIRLPVPSLPIAAKPPTLAELKIMLARVQSFKSDMPVGSGAYLGEDWQTQGDWMGRYGTRYAVLCAGGAPMNNYVLSDFSYTVSGFVGQHHDVHDSLRAWCHWVHTADPRVLWNPIADDRREAEWDDHGESYPQSFDGPNVWAKVTVPAGAHRLSLYLMNKDGHDGQNRDRDYLVELKAEPSSFVQGKGVSATEAASADMMPTLAIVRVHNFWFGVYKQFLVRGPSVYMVKIGRNGSFNTTLQTVMLDKLSGPPTKWETRHSVWYGRNTYGPPTAAEIKTGLASVTAAQSLWSALDQSADKAGVAQVSLSYRLMAYRTLADAVVIPQKKALTQQVLANWRWHLSLWDLDQREEYQRAMHETWHELAERNPTLKLQKQ